MSLWGEVNGEGDGQNNKDAVGQELYKEDKYIIKYDISGVSNFFISKTSQILNWIV